MENENQNKNYKYATSVVFFLIAVVVVLDLGWIAIVSVIFGGIVASIVTNKDKKHDVNIVDNDTSVIHITNIGNSNFTNQGLDNIPVTIKDEPSIIDITPTKSPNESPIVEVPYWEHHYVYSRNEIYKASHKQRQFYFLFKNKFLNGECLDLNGNTNYAFILLFDLLSDYDKQQTDIVELENHLKLLGQHYPKTKSYANRFLIQKMEEAGNNEGVEIIREEKEYYYDYWELGFKYRNKLNLTLDQVELLNNIFCSGNNFNAIDFCMKEIIKLYFSLEDELKNKYIREGTTLDAEFESVAILIAKQKYNYSKGLDTRNKYLVDVAIYEIYSNIFKYCENAVREFYGHKRKININMDYNVKTKDLYETKIYSKITALLPDLVLKITPPDEETEIELNTQNKTRWKKQFKILTKNYAGNPKEFVNAIVALGKLNKNNPSVKLVFFEASKFIAKHDRISALSLYVHYLYHDLKSPTFDNLQLTKTIQKSLFKNNEQLREFEMIVSEFLQGRNLEKALQDVSNMYTPKRKKIQLDTDSIKKVRQQHTESVALLNEYLKDESEDENNIVPQTEENTNTGDIRFSQIQLATLSLFTKNNFSVLHSDIETFARSKSVLKNQLVASINELCYELLDDVLIEEDAEYYIINQNYYQQVLAK